MAKFVKGQIANPTGRPKLPEHLREIRQLSRQEVVATITKFFRIDAKALQSLIDANTGITGLERSIIKNILDYNKLGFLLDQTIGKVVEQVAVFQGVGNPEEYDAIPAEILNALIDQTKTIDVTPKEGTNEPAVTPSEVREKVPG